MYCHFYPLFYEALCKQYTHQFGRDDVGHLKMLRIHECASFSSQLYYEEELFFSYSRPLFQCSFKRYQKDKTATRLCCRIHTRTKPTKSVHTSNTRVHFLALIISLLGDYDVAFCMSFSPPCICSIFQLRVEKRGEQKHNAAWDY